MFLPQSSKSGAKVLSDFCLGALVDDPLQKGFGKKRICQALIAAGDDHAHGGRPARRWCRGLSYAHAQGFV